MPEVFVSYSSKDQSAAFATVTALESNGVSCWVAPRDIVPGLEWGEAIVNGIESCSIFLLLFSENANESPQVRREVERAVSKGLVVLPVRLEDVIPQRSLEYFLSAAHWMDAFPEPFDAYLESLVEVIQTFRGTQPPQAQAAQRPPQNLKAKTPLTAILSYTALVAVAGIIAWLAFRDGEGHGPIVTTPTPAPPSQPTPPEPKPPAKLRPIPTSGFLVESVQRKELQAISKLQEKMNKIIFPEVKLAGASLEEAVELLRIRSKELDTETTDPVLKGVNLIMRTGDEVPNVAIGLDLKQVPMAEALRYITELAGVKYKVQRFAVTIVPITEATTPMQIRVYPFNDELVEEAKEDFRSMPVAPTGNAADPFAPSKPSSVPALSIFTPKGWLMTWGISFPDESAAVIDPKNQTLIVRNTEPNHAIIGDIISRMYSRFKNLERPMMNEETLGENWNELWDLQ